ARRHGVGGVARRASGGGDRHARTVADGVADECIVGRLLARTDGDLPLLERAGVLHDQRASEHHLISGMGGRKAEQHGQGYEQRAAHHREFPHGSVGSGQVREDYYREGYWGQSMKRPFGMAISLLSPSCGTLRAPCWGTWR